MPPAIYIQERKKLDPTFLAQPAAKDYVGARAYLGLIMPDVYADKAIALLKKAPVQQFRATDLARGGRLGLVDKKDPGVQKAMDEMQSGEPTSPVLIVQGMADTESNMAIADGFHRIHAAYYIDPDMLVSAKVAKGVFEGTAP